MRPPMGAPNAPGAGRPGSPGAPRQAFRGEVSRFAPRQMQVWRGGQWRHEHHRGRDGWWWVVDGTWYFYPYPIYPYPTYAAEEFYEDEYSTPYTWYYCDYPPGYYPYVQSCAYPWREIPARPPY